jgi:hypothetical protein
MHTLNLKNGSPKFPILSVWCLTSFSVMMLCAGCVDASRLNDSCRWVDPVSRQLDLSSAADREHLRADVEVAWEVGMRAADIRYRSVPSLSNPIRRACRNPLLDSIKARHGVSQADLDRAWTWRIWWADTLTVLLPMALVTAFAMGRVARRIRRSVMLTEMGGPARSGAAILASVVVALFSIGVAQTWGMGIEMLRIRDQHIAACALVTPVIARQELAYLCSFVLCLVVAAWTLTRSMPPGELMPDVPPFRCRGSSRTAR